MRNIQHQHRKFVRQVFRHRLLDRQTGRVVARDMWAVETHHLARLNDEVFKKLIQGRSKVDR